MKLDDKVRVRLTEIGTSKWRGKHGVTRSELEMPLWELMAKFGGNTAVLHLYFVDNEIELVS